jgi:hypothetical protein
MRRAIAARTVHVHFEGLQVVAGVLGDAAESAEPPPSCSTTCPVILQSFSG